MLKMLITVIGNIGGFIAIANLAYSLWEKRLNVSASIFETWDADIIGGNGKQLHHAHIVLTNNSGQMISVLLIRLKAGKELFEVNRDRGFIMMKKFDDYEYPFFRDGFPVNIPAKSSIDLRLEVIGDVKWNKLEKVQLTTSHRTKDIPLKTENMRSVSQYQFR